MVTELLIYKILQMFTFMAIGFLITKLKIIEPKDSMVLSKVCLYLLMPSSIINAFDFEQTVVLRNGLLFSFLVAIILHIILLLLDKLYSKHISSNGVERASVMYSNAGNIIIPIVAFVMGEEWIVFSTPFLSVQLFFLMSHGVRLFSPYEKINIKKVLLNVNIIAMTFGILMMLFGCRLPAFVKDITSSFGGMLGPVGMLIAGILGANIDFRNILTEKKIYRVIIARLVIYPVIMLITLKLLAVVPVVDRDKILLISFLACTSPAAASILQFSKIYNNDAEYATAINMLTTVGCVLTMPLFVALFHYL